MTATDALSAGHDTPDIPSRPDAAEMPALSIDGVSHSYGARQALIDIGFTRRTGEFHGVAWPERRRQEHAVLADHAAVRNPARTYRHFRP